MTEPSHAKRAETTDPMCKPENLHVITENGEQCFMWNSHQLTYIAQDRQELPAILATKFGHLATRLDLSYNSLTSFKGINLFTCLNELILDNNNFDDEHLDFRKNLRLKTLSLNKNRLTNLYKLINSIKTCFPNLEYLSLIGNPLCPGPILNSATSQIANKDSNQQNTTQSILPDAATATILSGGMRIDELVLNEVMESNPKRDMAREIVARKRADFNLKKYRHFIIYHLPNLRFLDSSPITATERDEALKRCFWMSQATLNQLNGAPNGNSGNNYFADTTNGRACRNGQSQSYAENECGGGLVPDGQEQPFQLTIMSNNSDVNQQPKGIFSRLAYKYTGRNSEGNRFIRNQDL